MRRFRSILITIICSILILVLSFSSFPVMDYFLFRSDSSIAPLSVSNSINSANINQQLQVFPWDTEQYKAFQPSYDNHWPGNGYNHIFSILWNYLEIYSKNVLEISLNYIYFSQNDLSVSCGEEFAKIPCIYEFTYITEQTEQDKGSYNLIIDQIISFNDDSNTKYRLQAAITKEILYSVHITPIVAHSNTKDFQTILQTSYQNLKQKPIENIQSHLLYTYMAADQNNQIKFYSPYQYSDEIYDYSMDISTKLIKTSDQLVCFSYLTNFLYFLWFDPYTCRFIGYDFVYLDSKKYSFESPTLSLIDENFSSIIYNN